MLQNNLFLRVMLDARKTGSAVAAINILNYNTARATLRAAQAAGRDVILQPSTGTVKRYGVSETYSMVEGLRRAFPVRASLHLDHCRDSALARACIDAGWDSVMMDFSALPMEENIGKTREIVLYAHERGVAVEGEVGVISGVEEDISAENAHPANYEDTVRFIRESGVDAIAPSIGTAHGFYKNAPVLNYGLTERLGKLETPLVVHGGTGLSPEAFHKLIRLGAAKVNISTALKQTYLGTARGELQNPKVNPIDFDLAVEDACAAMLEKHIRLFGGEDITL